MGSDFGSFKSGQRTEERAANEVHAIFREAQNLMLNILLKSPLEDTSTLCLPSILLCGVPPGPLAESACFLYYNTLEYCVSTLVFYNETLCTMANRNSTFCKATFKSLHIVLS